MDRFEKEGFAITAALLSSTEIAELITRIERSQPDARRGGVRDVMDAVPELRTLADHVAVRTIVEQVLEPNAFVVRSTLFDKTGDANWKVPWHQDVTIAVAERRDVLGYGPWSVKADIAHVQPPTHVLERMVTVRIHLDPCPSSNGALRVQPGTHRLGRINQNSVGQHIDEDRAVTCEAQIGEALVMRPLLLHTSSASEIPGHRRIVHFDFAMGDLDGRLNWRMR